MPGFAPGPTRRHRNPLRTAPGFTLAADARAADPPRAPKGLGAAGKRFWNAACEDPITSIWQPVQWLELELAACLAERLAAGDEKAALYRVLADMERVLGLTPASKRALGIVVAAAEPEPVAEVASFDPERRARLERGMREGA